MRRGSATASDLIFETPEALHAIRQLGVGSQSNEPLEAQVEEALTYAIGELPQADAKAARIMLGVNPAFRSTLLKARREEAAQALGVVPGTFRNRHEDRLLDALSQKVALALLSRVSGMDSGDTDGELARDPGRVLMIHGRDSFGVKEVARLVETLGLEPVYWEEALDRTGVWSPSVIERFRSCLDVAQGVLVVLEGGLGESAVNLAFEAGLALGLAEARTVVVQLGDQTPPRDLAEVNILRLRSTEESVNALSAALRKAGCAVMAGTGPSKEFAKGIDTGWFHWTPANAENPVYADIAAAVRTFEPVPVEAGAAAANWLKQEALEQYPETSTYLLLGDGRVEGFVGVRSSSLSVEFEHGERESVGVEPSIPALIVSWMAIHRDSAGKGEELLLFATSLVYTAGEEAGAAALMLEIYDEGTASVLEGRFPFLRRAPNSNYLWLPITIPRSAPKL